MKKYEYVIVIGIDGMGNFNKDAHTPNMDALFKNGAFTEYGYSLNPTISAQNWGAMLLGAEPYIHKLTNSIVENNLYTNADLPSVFSIIRKHYPDAVLSSYCNWNPINYGIIEHNSDVNFETADNDEVLTDKIIDNIKNKPTFFFIQFDQCDGAGHRFGYGTEDHIAQIEKTDTYVGRIVDEYKKQGIFEDTLFIVLADHGGYIKGHGGYTDTEKYIFFGVSGKNVKPGKIEYVATKDISAVVLYALGIDIPQYSENGYTSQLPRGIFYDADREYIRIMAKPNYVKTEITPDFNSEKGMSRYVPIDRLKLALFFDNDTRDQKGKDIKEDGLIKYYSDGVYSSYAEMGIAGCISAEDIKLNNNSFTVGMWFMIDKAIKAPAGLCGTKEYNLEPMGRGFVLLQQLMDTMLCISNGEKYREIIVPFKEISDGWVHVIVVFDKEDKQIRFYYNFKHAFTDKLEDEFICNMDNMPFTIGNDAAHKLNNVILKELVKIDDFVLFDSALSEDEIKKFAQYYN